MRSMIDLCFMCSNDNECTIVDNKIVTQVEYVMPEITIFELRLPLRFCSSCEQKLQLFSTFKKDCVENSLRLEAWIKEAPDNTDVRNKCTTSKTKINKIDEVYIKEEVIDNNDKLEVKYSLEDEISIKEDPLQENPSGCELDLLQEILKDESPLETDTNFHEYSSVDMGDESDKNSDDHDVVSDNNEFNSDENILVTGGVSGNNKEFQCNKRKKWFSQKSNLVTHIKQHTGVKYYQCNECIKWFFHKSKLVTHMKQHTGVKDYQCNECKKWFSQKAHLVTHMKQHTGVKDFQCNECKKWFSQKVHLVIHMKQHTRVKDYECNECEKWFLHKSSLVKHMKLHRGRD